MGSPNDQAILAAALLQSRRTILPKRLVAPGPDAEQLQLILNAAASAPDHGQLLPWRFVVVPATARTALADVFSVALRERDAQATPEQMAQAQEKAHRAPLLMLVVVDALKGDPQIDVNERIVSAGCAIQNMLLMATALGFGSALTSGKALKASGLRSLFGLGAGEQALCFVSVGSVQSSKGTRLRPTPDDYVSTLMATQHNPGAQAAKALTSAIAFPGHRAPAAGLESPFEMLVACHERVNRSLDVLDRLQQHVAAKGLDEEARQAARDVMRYFDQAAPLHHQDEELHVFPPLLAGSDTQMHDLVRKLMQDHREMESCWTAAREVLRGIADGHPSLAMELAPVQADVLHRFSALYGQHIADEEDTVYPQARSVLPEEGLQAMSQDMMRRRGVV